MWYREKTAVCFEIHTTLKNSLGGQHVKFLNIKPGGSNHWALKGKYHLQESQKLFCTMFRLSINIHTGIK
jgi:hypothetical protein